MLQIQSSLYSFAIIFLLFGAFLFGVHRAAIVGKWDSDVREWVLLGSLGSLGSAITLFLIASFVIGSKL